MAAIKDIAGQRFGRLVVIAFSHIGKDNKGRTRWACWLCRCDCGAEKIINSHDLHRGGTQSCGCLRRESVAQRRTTHGHKRHGKGSPTYKSWESMNARCDNPKHDAYKYYGGRGIIVCSEWRNSFKTFLHHMGPRPLGTTLDRIHPELDYEKSNCKWSTPKEQRANQRPRKRKKT